MLNATRSTTTTRSMLALPFALISLICAGLMSTQPRNALAQERDASPQEQAPQADQAAASDLSAWDGESWVVHEWGTFTTIQGSDASVIDGLSHEETDLPEFVYDLRDVYGVTALGVKMETPVIYFYAPESRHVKVSVDFPEGVITQWYPAALYVNQLDL